MLEQGDVQKAADYIEGRYVDAVGRQCLYDYWTDRRKELATALIYETLITKIDHARDYWESWTPKTPALPPSDYLEISDLQALEPEGSWGIFTHTGNPDPEAWTVLAYHTLVPEANSVIPLHSLVEVLDVHSHWGILQEGHFYPLQIDENLSDLVQQALLNLCQQITAYLQQPEEVAAPEVVDMESKVRPKVRPTTTKIKRRRYKAQTSNLADFAFRGAKGRHSELKNTKKRQKQGRQQQSNRRQPPQTEVVIPWDPDVTTNLTAGSTSALDISFADIYKAGDHEDRLGDTEAERILLKKYGCRIRRVPGGLNAMVMACMVTWGTEQSCIGMTLRSFLTDLIQYMSSSADLYDTPWAYDLTIQQIHQQYTEGIAIAHLFSPAHRQELPATVLYGLAGFLQCKLSVYKVEEDVLMSYQTVDYEGAAHIIIVDDYGCFTGTQPADDLPTEFVNLQAIVPFRSQDTRAIPPAPEWLRSTQGIQDNTANRRDITTVRYGTTGDLLICSLNVNGMTVDKLGDVLWWLGEHQIDILCCQDARLEEEEHQLYNEQVKTRLGAQAKCLIDPGVSAAGKKCKVGGQLIIVSHLWGGKCSNHKRDPTQHGVLSGVVIDLEDASKLLVLSAYWPVKAPAGDRRPGRMWNRLVQHIKSLRKDMTPLEYIQAEIDNMTTSHMGNGGQGGNSAILCGDFNASWFNKQASHTIKEWAGECQWSSNLEQYPKAKEEVRTYWHTPYKPTSWIDHVMLHKSSIITGTGGGVMYGPFWVTVSDHRPIFGWFQGQGLKRYGHMKHSPTKMPPTLKRIALTNFQDNREKFRTAMKELVHSLPAHTGAEGAGDLLKTISRRTVEAVPSKPLKPLLCSTFKDGWSPYAVAGKTHLKAIVTIRRHLLGTKNTHRWRDATEAALGIKQITDAWQTRVGKLKWKDNIIPKEVWGIGLSPREWCTIPFHRKRMSDLCKLNYSLVRKSLHGRKRKEEAMKISHAVWKREQKREERKLGEVIASMLGKRHQNFCIEALDLPPIILKSGEKAPMTSAETHQYVTQYICDQYQLVHEMEGTPDIVHGGLNWDGVQNFDQFRQAYPDLDIPGIPLEQFWKALVTVPKRETVSKELKQVFEHPPTFEDFSAAIASRDGRTAGGVSELSYNMVKEWPEELTRVVYGLLVEMWTDKYIPEWWRWRWLVPLPKQPTAPTLNGLRPIMLIEILRKIWAGLVARSIQDTITKHAVLHPSQHGFQKGHGTDTANLQLVNVMEEAKLKKMNLYGSSWDMRRAFDSVSKAVIRLAWQRLGVPDDITDWLVRLDEDSKTVVKSSWAAEQWVAKGYEGLAEAGSFHPETGTGQGDVFSPQTWVAIFDIVLCALDLVDHPDGFPLTSTGGTRYRAPAMCYADDDVSVASSLEGLQAQGLMISLCAVILGLSIAVEKLRAFKACWASTEKQQLAEKLMVHQGREWKVLYTNIMNSGCIKCLGVLYDIDYSGTSQFEASRKMMITIMKVLAK